MSNQIYTNYLRKIYPEFLNMYQTTNLHIYWHDKGKFLYVRWFGRPDRKTRLEGAEKIFELLKIKVCSKILNDNRNLENPLHYFNCTTSKWFPRMQKAHLKHFVSIGFKDLNNDRSPEHTLLAGTMVSDFGNYEDAFSYILQQPDI